MIKAVVLLSGGMDSATTLAIASVQRYQCYALSINYGQRNHSELAAAKKIALSLGAYEQKVITINLGAFGGSALTDRSIEVPTSTAESSIPITYVPARNTIMLSIALAWAETINCHNIFIGVNAVDYSGYPDCRREYIDAFTKMANLATKTALDGNKTTIHAPLISWSKEKIIRKGISLGIDYSVTISCYKADTTGLACGNCDACHIRRKGFSNAGITDPTHYKTSLQQDLNNTF